MPLPLLQKLLGHSSIRTTALYWQNIHGDNELEDILAGKDWLKGRKKPKLPIAENFPETPKGSDPIFINQIPVVPNKNPTHADNSLSLPKTLKKAPEELISGISPKTAEKFLLNNPSQKNDQLKTNQSLALTANKERKPTERELILLQKIKQLEEQLKQVQVENKKLKIEKEKAEQLAQHERKRANQLEIKLKTVAQILCQLQKINYYKQLDQEQKAQIEQPPFKPPNK